jgi:hypothetical protein
VNNLDIVKPAAFDELDLEGFNNIMHLNLRCSTLAARVLGFVAQIVLCRIHCMNPV